MEIIALTSQCLGKADMSPQPFPVAGKFFPPSLKENGGYDEAVSPARWHQNQPILGPREPGAICERREPGSFSGPRGRCLSGAHCRGERLHELGLCGGPGSGRANGAGERAQRWAKDRDLAGLRLETQDNNLMACRFYLKQGFQVGGVNDLPYHTLPAPKNQEAAVFFYLLF